MTFIPYTIPRNPDECPAWLYETLHRLNRQATNLGQGVAAIVRGEAPDGSGSPLVDLSLFFYKPGILGGQIAYGDTGAAGKLTLSSTKSSSKGFIYLGDSLASAFDEANNRLGLSSAAPGAKLEIKQPGTTVGYSPSSLGGGTSGGWIGDNGDSGATRYTRVNEATADDATYVSDAGLGPAMIFQTVFSAIPAQSSGATVMIRARIRWNGSDAGAGGFQMSMLLRDGNGTTIHDTGNISIKAAHGSGDTGFTTTLDFTLSGAEITSIANWTGMVVAISTAGGGTGYTGTTYISWVQIQIAGAASAVDLIDLYDTNGTLVSGFNAAGGLFLKSGAASGYWLKSDANGLASWSAPAALTKTDDTNVTLTLGGSATTALLNAASLTLGWTGQLSIARGGTGASSALAAFNALSPLTTRGDLLTRDASNNVRLGIGAANTILTSNGTDPAWVAGTALTLSVKDTLFSVVDDGDTTKKMVFECSGITTATTRTLTVPNVSGTLLASGTLTVTAMNLTLKGGTSQIPLTIQQRATLDTSDLLKIINQNNTLTLFVVSSAGNVTCQGLASNGDVSGASFTIKDTNTGDPASFAMVNTPTGGQDFHYLPFPVVGPGNAYIVEHSLPVDQTAKTAGIAATTITTTAKAGCYRMSVALACSTSAGGAGTIQVSITYTQNGVTRTRAITTALALTSTANDDSAVFSFFADNATDVKYTATGVGLTGTEKYDLHIRLEYIDT